MDLLGIWYVEVIFKEVTQSVGSSLEVGRALKHRG